MATSKLKTFNIFVRLLLFSFLYNKEVNLIKFFVLKGRKETRIKGLVSYLSVFVVVGCQCWLLRFIRMIQSFISDSFSSFYPINLFFRCLWEASRELRKERKKPG